MILLGDGLLGTELYKRTNSVLLSRKNNGIEFDKDFNEYLNLIEPHNTVINCIANTDTYSDDKESHWNINYKRVVDLTDYCLDHNKKLVHISTDYVYSNSVSNASVNDVPVHCATWYGYTKLLSDAYVQLKLKNFLVIRTSFKPRPFPYPKAITTQIGNFDYVDVIADMIVKLITDERVGVFNVGTNVKSIYDLALTSNSNIEPLDKKLNDMMPTDITMDINTDI